MTKLKRNYSSKTLKVLFALSRNQCAHPDCTNALIEPATDASDKLVMAQICHIYAISEDGPRGKSGLTENELNSPENLILLCPNHHEVVDGQHETYTAGMLLEWKKKHESGTRKRLSADSESMKANAFSHPYFPTALVDQKIEHEVDILRRSRFYPEFDRARFSVTLARKLIDGELSGGTSTVRSRALAWSARILSAAQALDKAEEYLNFAKSLGTCAEIEIAHAFILSHKGEKQAALSALASIDAPIARSAALMVVSHHDGAEGAVEWLKTTAIDAADLDHDGKHFLLARYIYAFVTIVMFFAIRSQVNFMQRQTKATEDAAKAASDNAKAARENAEAIISSERAWVLANAVGQPRDPLFDPQNLGYTPGIVYLIEIAGKTPAKIVRERFRCRIVPALPGTQPPKPQLEAVPTYTSESGLFEGTAIYPPGHKYPISVSLDSGPLTAEQYEALRDGKKLHCAYGSIEYLDAFGRKGTTQVCAIYHFAFGGVISSPNGTILNPQGFRLGGPEGYNNYT